MSASGVRGTGRGREDRPAITRGELIERVARLVEEIAACPDEVPAALEQRLDRALTHLSAFDTSHPPRSDRTRFVTALLLVAVVVEALCVMHVSRTDVTLDVRTTALQLETSHDYSFGAPVTSERLSVGPIGGLRFVTAAASSSADSVPERIAAESAEIVTVAASDDGARRLVGVELPDLTSGSWIDIGAPAGSSEYRISVATHRGDRAASAPRAHDEGEPEGNLDSVVRSLHVNVAGPARCRAGDFATPPGGIGLSGRFDFEPARRQSYLDVHFGLAPAAAVELGPLLPVRALGFTEAGEMSQASSVVRGLPSVLDGKILLNELGGREIGLRGGQRLRLEGVDGALQQLRLTDGSIHVLFTGSVAGMWSGVDDSDSLMPTRLDWIVSRPTARLAWTTGAAALTALLGLVQRWRE